MYPLAQDTEQSAMCYMVGPWWLSILTVAVCTEPSQTPFNFTSGGFLAVLLLISNCWNLPFGTNGGWSLAYKKRGTKKPVSGSPTWCHWQGWSVLETQGEGFPFPVWLLEAVGIPWLVINSPQSLPPSSHCFLLWLWFLRHPFIKILVIMSGLLDNPGSSPHLNDS